MTETGARRGSAVYLDWNATTPPHPDVLGAMRSASEEGWANPASVHSYGRKAGALVESARQAVAALGGVDPRDVILTSGATESNNLALRNAPALVTSRIEHPSVVRVAEALEMGGRTVRWLSVPGSGRIDPDSVRKAVSDLPPGFVVALMAANHETGVLQPLREVTEIVEERAGLLHVDAVQAAGKIDPALWTFGSTTSLSAHKIRGPKGVGALLVRSGPKPAPILFGGAQERGVRPGTVDPVTAVGFGVAAELFRNGGPARYSRLAVLRDRLEAALAEVALGTAGDAPRLPHVASLYFSRWRGDELVAALDLEGVCVSSGSACSAGTHEPSPVILAMRGAEWARGTVRFSLGETTTSDEIDAAIEAIRRTADRTPLAALT